MARRLGRPTEVTGPSRVQLVGMAMGRGDLTHAKGIPFRHRTGVPWRDLSARFGKWKSAYEWHGRWSADGTWERCRAHQHGA
nr:transposase [Streptomyces albicerus]